MTPVILLAVLSILVERKVDTYRLASRWVSCQKNKYPSKHLDPPAMTLLLDYHWPGNVRELRNLMEKLVVMIDGEVITPGDVCRILRIEDVPLEGVFRPLKEVREEFEREYILGLL